MRKHATRKLLSLALVLALVCGLCMPALAAGGYSDTKGHWAEEAIDRWSAYGILEGYGDGRFGPDDPITRGQMAALLCKLLSLPETAADNPFVDVPKTAWYHSFVLRCYAAGIMLGSGSYARPEEVITREEAMTMLCRALAIAGAEDADLSAFTDGAETAAWAAPFVAALAGGGIVDGVGDGLLAPGGSMSRAAVVTVIDRLVSQYITAPGEYTLTAGGGLVLVAAGDVTLTGKTEADILVTHGADGKTVAFQEAEVAGSITVQADDATVTKKDSTLPEIALTGKGSEVKEEEEEKKEEPKPSTGGGGSGYVPISYDDLTVTEAGTVYGVYNDVTIAYSVGNDTVILDGVEIKGDLIVKGGGSHSVRLIKCVVDGKVIMAKENDEPVRLLLEETPIETLEVRNNAIIETADDKSTVNILLVPADTKGPMEIELAGTGEIPVKINATEPVSLTVPDGVTVELSSDGETQPDVTVNGTPVCIHKWDEGVITTPATEEAEGVKTYTCAYCGETRTEAVPKIVHDWSAWTKEDDTYHKRTCADCDEVEREAHQWNDGEVTKEATETEAGVKTFTCTVCGGTKTEEIPVHQHEWSDWTKDDDTNHKHTCDGCGEVETEAHKWNGGEVTKAATTEAAGEKTYTCTVCGATKTEEIAKLNGYVEAPRGIAAAQQFGYTIEVEFLAPNDNANINYYSVYLYDSSKKDASLIEKTHEKTTRTTRGESKREGYFVYFTRDELSLAYNYDKVEITAHGMNGYGDATWSGSISITRTNAALSASYIVENIDNPTDSYSKRLTLTLNSALSGFFKVRVWLNGAEVNSTIFSSATNTATIYHVINADEEAALANPSATVKLIGWDVTQCEMVGGVPTIAFTDYAETIATKA